MVEIHRGILPRVVLGYTGVPIGNYLEAQGGFVRVDALSQHLEIVGLIKNLI